MIQGIKIGDMLFVKNLGKVKVINCNENMITVNGKNRKDLDFIKYDIGKVIFFKERHSRERFNSIEDYLEFCENEKIEMIKKEKERIYLEKCEKEKIKKREIEDEIIRRKKQEKKKDANNLKDKKEKEVIKPKNQKRNKMKNEVKSFRSYYPKNSKDVNSFTKDMLSFKAGNSINVNQMIQIVEPFFKKISKKHKDVAIITMPSSRANHWGEGLLKTTKVICGNYKFKDCSRILLRYNDVDPSHRKYADRSIEKHLKSIRIDKKNGYRRLSKNTYIILLDDIVTTGNSLAAIEMILKDDGFSNIHKVAIAKTDHKD